MGNALSLNRDHGHGPIEEAQNIKETRSDMFCDYDCVMSKAGPSLSLNVPVFNSSDDMTCVEFS
jgi:hypothetical protein